MVPQNRRHTHRVAAITEWLPSTRRMRSELDSVIGSVHHPVRSQSGHSASTGMAHSGQSAKSASGFLIGTRYMEFECPGAQPATWPTPLADLCDFRVLRQFPRTCKLKSLMDVPCHGRGSQPRGRKVLLNGHVAKFS